MDEQDDSSDTPALEFPLPNIPEWPQQERLQFERELTGFYITAHPLNRHAMAIQQFSTRTTASLSEVREGKDIKLCGIISSLKSHTTKKGNLMAYINLEDLHGTAEIIVFPDLYATSQEFMVPEAIVQITGTIDQMDKGTRIKATAIQPLQDLMSRSIKSLTLHIKESAIQAHDVSQLYQLVQQHPGPTPISFTFNVGTDLQVETARIPDLGVSPNVEFLESVQELLGKSTITLHE